MLREVVIIGGLAVAGIAVAAWVKYCDAPVWAGCLVITVASLVVHMLGERVS